MPTPELDTTFQLLQNTRNAAAVPVLVTALSEPEATIQQAAVEALLSRRSRQGQLAIVSCLDRLAPSAQDEVHRQAVRLDSGIRDALASRDPRVQENASALLAQANDFSLAHLLICCLSEGDTSTRRVAMDSFRALIGRYQQLVEQAAGGESVPVDLEQARSTLVAAVRKGIDTFAAHGEPGLIECYLVLTQAPDELIVQVLMGDRHPAHAALMELLRTTTCAHVVRWLLDLLRRKESRDLALRLLTSRRDEPFLQLLLSQVHWLSDAWVSAQFKRVRHLPWLSFDTEFLCQADGRLQASAVILGSQLGLPPAQKLALYAGALRVAQPEARRAAVCALGHLNGPDADALLLRCTADQDPQVQAAATQEALARQLTEATGVAIRQLDSDNPQVRQSARTALARYDFDKYWRSFDRMDDWSRREAGRLIRKIDPHMGSLLAQAVQSTEKAQRFRAVRMIALLGVDAETAPHLVQLAHDPDHMVRAHAVRALDGVASHEAAQAVGASLADRNGRVRANAVQTLYRLNDPRTIDVLRVMTQDPVARVRANAVVGLFKLGRADESRGLLTRMAGSEDPAVRASALWAAFQTRDEQGIGKGLEALQHDPNPKVRQLAARLLGTPAAAPEPAPDEPAVASGVAP